MADINITIDDEVWDDNGPSCDPDCRLLADISINGLQMHLEAFRVIEGADGTIRPCVCVADEYWGIYESIRASGVFRYITIREKLYSLFATPYCM